LARNVVPLRVSQLRGVQWLLSHPRALLLWPVGAGKTRTTLEGMARICAVDGGAWLIVATRRVVCDGRVWQSEASEWGIPLTLVTLHGNARQRAAQAAQRGDAYVTTYDLLHTPEVQAVMRRCIGVVFDELSMCKHFSRRFRAARKGTDHMRYHWGLTATPATEHLSDLFYPVQLLDDGERFGRSREAFMLQYFRQLDLAGHLWKLRHGADAQLFSALGGLAHRITYDELPPVVTQRISVPLESAQTVLYRTLERDLIAKVGDRDLVVGSSGVLAAKLRQLCSGFVYQDGAPVWLSIARLTALDALVEELAGQPLIVVYEYVAEREAILERLPWMRTLDEPGVIAAWNKGEVRGLLMHARSGGHGLNLQFGGHHLLWFTLSWSAELMVQVRGRLARPGQKNTVIEHVFTAPGTVETKRVWPSLMAKLDTEQRLLDSVAS
jgi:SNF2 family DNA or RNA helicase